MTDADYKKLRDALDNLIDEHDFLLSVQRGDSMLAEIEEFKTSEKEQARLERVAKNSVVKSFEICYEMLWKYLKMHLEQDLTSLPNSPLGIYKSALEGGFITTDMAESLNRYHNARINSVHDYAQKKGETVIAITANFIDDAEELYGMMTEQ